MNKFLQAILSPFELGATSRSSTFLNLSPKLVCNCFILYIQSFGLKWKNICPRSIRNSPSGLRVLQSHSSTKF